MLAPVLTRLELELASGAATELRARPLAAQVRPELRVWDPAARREVARAIPPWLGGDSVLRLPAGAGVRRYQLLVFARALASSGPVALSRDGQLLAPRAQAGGLELALATDAVTAYQAAAAPGGLRHALLLGLGRDGALLALDERSGPSGLPKLTAADLPRPSCKPSASATSRWIRKSSRPASRTCMRPSAWRPTIG